MVEGGGQVATVVNRQSIVDDDGFETLLFPLLVPVLVLGFVDGVADGDTLDGKNIE